MTELSVLERVRAAVAEAGYDPNQIVEGDEKDPVRYLRTLPAEVAWRAKETLDLGPVACFRCWESPGIHDGRLRGLGCLADRRFVEDCGRDRSEP